MKKPLAILWLVSIACTIVGIPYAFELQKDVIAKVILPFPVFILITILQTAVLLAVAVYLGAKLAGGIGLRIFALGEVAPGEERASKIKEILKLGIPVGAATAVAIYLADYYFLTSFTPRLSVGTAGVTIWKTILAAFYGGVVEEVLMRLFLLSLVAWVLTKLFKSEKPKENKTIMWSAIIASSVIFGLGHLPATASLTAITVAVVVRAIVLNGIGGLMFGWLYWKKGLEYGIVAHFTADIVLLVVLPAMFR